MSRASLLPASPDRSCEPGRSLLLGGWAETIDGRWELDLGSVAEVAAATDDARTRTVVDAHVILSPMSPSVGSEPRPLTATVDLGREVTGPTLRVTTDPHRRPAPASQSFHWHLTLRLEPNPDGPAVDCGAAAAVGASVHGAGSTPAS